MKAYFRGVKVRGMKLMVIGLLMIVKTLDDMRDTYYAMACKYVATLKGMGVIDIDDG